MIMPVKPPAHLFRVDHIDITQIKRDIQGNPVVEYQIKETVKEVEKVIYKDDPKLLEQLNRVLRENGELKQALAKQPLAPEETTMLRLVPTSEKVEPSPVKMREVEKLVAQIKTDALVYVGCFLAGALACYLILK